MASYGGQPPGDEATLRSFKGIGAYTTGAVMSFAFGKREAILDTRVARVLYRVFAGRGDRKNHVMDGRNSGRSSFQADRELIRLLLGQRTEGRRA